MDQINEKSTAIISLTFTDEDDVAITPDTVSYILYDKISGTVRTSGTATPASTVELEFTPEDNEILDQNNRYEIAEVQVLYTYGTKTGRDIYTYKIINLPKTI